MFSCIHVEMFESMEFRLMRNREKEGESLVKRESACKKVYDFHAGNPQYVHSGMCLCACGCKCADCGYFCVCACMCLSAHELAYTPLCAQILMRVSLAQALVTDHWNKLGQTVQFELTKTHFLDWIYIVNCAFTFYFCSSANFILSLC